MLGGWQERVRRICARQTAGTEAKIEAGTEARTGTRAAADADEAEVPAPTMR